MGRYGAALPDAVSILPAAPKADQMPDMPGMPSVPSVQSSMPSSMHMNTRCHL
jgi:hypothetical protein